MRMLKSRIPFLFTVLSRVFVLVSTWKMCMRAYASIGEREGGRRVSWEKQGAETVWTMEGLTMPSVR